jgi:hypothetical protein
VGLKATWQLKSEGVFENRKVVSLNPENDAFKICFVKEINKLQLKSESQKLTAELEFVSFLGSEHD